MPIQCKNKCPLDKFSGCCRSCPDLSGCPEACEHDPANCGESTFKEETGLALFQKSQLATLEKIATVVAMKKAAEEQEKALKASLYEAMVQYGVKKFESEVLDCTLVLPTVSTSIDAAKLKKKFPEAAAECSKTSSKAGYVKITLKDGDKDAG